MNFSLRVVGFPGLQVHFSRIAPDTAAADCVAYVIASMCRFAQSAPSSHEVVRLVSLLNSVVSSNAVMISDDGQHCVTVLGENNAIVNVSASHFHDDGGRGDERRAREPTARECFGVLDDGRLEGLRGWLYFTRGKQTLKVVTKVHGTTEKSGGSSRFGGGSGGGGGGGSARMLTVAATDLLLSTVGEVKMIIAERLGIRVGELLMTTARGSNESIVNGASATGGNPMLSSSSSLMMSVSGFDGGNDGNGGDGAADELSNGESLFHLLRERGEGVICAVRREGLVVEVHTQSGRRIALSRFPLHATMAHVARRLQNTFGVQCGGLGPLDADGCYAPDVELVDVMPADGALVLVRTVGEVGHPVLLRHTSEQQAGPPPQHYYPPPPAVAHAPVNVIGAAATRFHPSETYLQHAAALVVVPGATYEGGVGEFTAVGVSSPPAPAVAHAPPPMSMPVTARVASTSFQAVTPGSVVRPGAAGRGAALYHTKTTVVATVAAGSKQRSGAPAVRYTLPMHRHFTTDDLLAALQRDGHLPVPVGLSAPLTVLHGRRALRGDAILQQLVPDDRAAEATILLTVAQ